MINAKPIKFSGEMIRAILDGRKTQTRRIVKDVPEHTERLIRQNDGRFYSSTRGNAPLTGDWSVECPYGEVGTQLWVQETIKISKSNAENEYPTFPKVTYQADGAERTFKKLYTNAEGLEGQWRPPADMPYWASRITLEITNIRVERLQEISGDDVEAEGVDVSDMPETVDIYIQRFRHLWDRRNGKHEGCSWSDNPFVWVIEFKRLEV